MLVAVAPDYGVIWVVVAKVPVVSHRQPKRFTAISKNSMHAEHACGKISVPEGVEQIRERGCPRFGQRTGRSCLGVQLQMGEHLLDHFGIFNAGNDLHGTAAVLAGGDMPQGTFS